MSFIQENVVKVNLGVSKEYVLIQISDVHAVTFDHRQDDDEAIAKARGQEKVWMRQRLDFAKKFQEAYDSSALYPSTECLRQLLDYANENHPNLVLLTGDIVDYYSPTNYDFLETSIRSLKSPYLFSCGNHESPTDPFQGICHGNVDFQTVDLGEFMVVSIHNAKRKIKPDQLSALEDLLQTNKPLILTMHIPMMTEYNTAEFTQLDSYYSMKYNDCDETTSQFIRLVASSDAVKVVFCGHTHGSIASLIAPNKIQYCCSSGLIGHVNKIIIQ
jgi:predicted MPP superfamily phosphohydrolase